MLSFSPDLSEYISEVAKANENRRREHRFRTSENVSFRSVNPVKLEGLDGTVLDVSKSGLRLRSPIALRLGTHVQIKMGGLSIRGEVRYSVDAGESAVDHGISVFEVWGDKALVV